MLENPAFPLLLVLVLDVCESLAPLFVCVLTRSWKVAELLLASCRSFTGSSFLKRVLLWPGSKMPGLFYAQCPRVLSASKLNPFFVWWWGVCCVPFSWFARTYVAG